MAYFIEINEDGTPKISSSVYTTNVDSLIPLMDITSDINSRWSGSGREKNSIRYFIVVNNNYVPQSGTVTTTRPASGKYVDITRSYLRQTKVDSYLLDENALYLLLIAGHSNSTNMSHQARPVSFVNESVNNNKKVEWNDDNSDMRVVDNILSTPNDRLPQHIFQPTFYGQNNPAVIMGNEMSKLIKKVTGKTIQFITVSGATNGACIDNGNISFAELSNNSIHYQYFIQGIQKAKDYADSVGKVLKPAFMVLVNGEVEAIFHGSIPESEYRYRSVMNKYLNTLWSVIAQITGQSYKFPVFRHQLHGQQMTDDNNMNVKQYVLNSSRRESPVIVASYQVSILSGSDHWDTTATFQIFGSFVHNIFRHQYQDDGIIFRPKRFTRTNNEITVYIDVPTPPLRIDTSRGLETYHGFTIKDSSNVEIPITSLEVGARYIKITAASNPTGGTLYYKLKRPYVPDLNRPASYIADSEYFTYYGLTISNYLLSFKQIL